MSSALLSSIISLLFAIILLPSLIFIFKLRKNESSIIFIAFSAFFGSKLIIANRISIYKDSSWINSVNDDVLLALVILGVFITSSFVRFIYHYLNVYTKKRKITFWIAASIAGLSTVILLITQLSNSSAVLYGLVIASFGYGCVESLTGMINILFAERRKLPWISVPIMVTIPAIASLFATPVHSLLFEVGMSNSNIIVIIGVLSLVSFGIFAFLIYKMMDAHFVPYKYLSSDPTTAKKMIFQFWFGFLTAITLSFFSNSVNTLVFSEWNYPKLKYFISYLSLLILVIGVVGSSLITRYLLERYRIKTVLLLGCGLIIISLVSFATTEAINVSSPLTGFIILPIIIIGTSIIYTIVFTKSIESQIFSSINVTKYFLSIKAFGYIIGGLIVYLLISNNSTSVAQKSYFWSLIILINLWTISFVGIQLRYQKTHPDHTKIRDLLIENKKIK